MEEISAVLALVLIHLSAEPNIALCLFHAKLKLLQPDVAVPIHELVKLLKPEEHCARGRAYDEKWFIANDRIPTFRPVSQFVEIVSTLDIHGLSRSQSGLLAYTGHAQGAEDLANISAAQLCVEALHGAAAHRQLDPRIGIDFMQRLTKYGSGQNKFVLTLRPLHKTPDF